MRLPDDDEIYDVDATYLGPPGRYIGRFRHKTMIIWPLLFLLTLAVQQRVGLGMSLLSIGLTILGVTWLTAWIADHTNAERPVRVMATVLWHELSAARPTLRGTRSGKPRVHVHTPSRRARKRAQARAENRAQVRDHALDLQPTDHPQDDVPVRPGAWPSGGGSPGGGTGRLPDPRPGRRRVRDFA